MNEEQEAIRAAYPGTIAREWDIYLRSMAGATQAEADLALLRFRLGVTLARKTRDDALKMLGEMKCSKT